MSPMATWTLAFAGRRRMAYPSLSRMAARGIVGLAAAVLLVATVASLLAGMLASHNPNDQQLTKRLLPPAWATGGTWEYPLGTDPLGRDLYSRLLYGGRTTLLIALAAVSLSAVIGIVLGLVSGFYGGLVDELTMRLADLQLAIPSILLAIALIAVLDISLRSVVLVLGISGWVMYSRIIRAQILTIKQHEYVLAARAIGARDLRIILRHILPNVVNTFLVLATLEAARVITLESALSFLGLGIRPPAMSWGSILADGRDDMTTAWWTVTFPGI